MKATYRLSGDQKGVEAPSVPGKRRQASTSRSRNHKAPRTVENTILRPSGDTDTSSLSVTSSGTDASNRPGAAGAVG